MSNLCKELFFIIVSEFEKDYLQSWLPKQYLPIKRWGGNNLGKM